MANNNIFIYFSIALTLSNCNPDTLDTISFEVSNQYDKTIEVKFTGYSVKGHQPSDTVFVILSGEKRLVYFDDGRVLPKDQYIRADTLQFCDSIELSSENIISSENFTIVSKWNYERINNHTEVYTLKISEDDF